jgi:5-dehydro-2-deoxygluconokinase
VIVDDRYGQAILPRLTARGFWIARPVEVPGSVPLAFEAGDNVGLHMRAWPASHVAKCLVYFHPDDAPALKNAQLARLGSLARACHDGGRELLVEVIPPAGSSVDPLTLSHAMEAIYGEGIRPDWWKLPPSPQPAAWRFVGEAIERFDPHCRGVLVLGMEAGSAALREGFTAAQGPWVHGFAVGRSIFAPAAEAWLRGEWNDARAVDDIAARYLEVIGLWEEARGQIKETA